MITQGKWEVGYHDDNNDIVIRGKNQQIVANCTVDFYGGHPQGEEIQANADLIAAAPETKKQRDALLDACKAQHKALDILFAMLIQKDEGFLPSKSGQPWEAIVEGDKAIKEAEK